MNKEIRDALLEIYATIRIAENNFSRNPMIAMLESGEIRRLQAIQYRVAQLYHHLADEQDLASLDEDGFPTDFQLKRINKMTKKTRDEFCEKASELKRFHCSMRHGDLIPIAKKEPSKCDGCGHVHD